MWLGARHLWRCTTNSTRCMLVWWLGLLISLGGFPQTPTANDKLLQLCQTPSNIPIIVQCPRGVLPERGDDVHNDPEWLDKALRLYCTEIPDACDPTRLDPVEERKRGY